MSCLKKYICIILTVLVFSVASTSVFATVSVHESAEGETEETSDIETDESGVPVDTAEQDSTGEVSTEEESSTDDAVQDETVVEESTGDEVFEDSDESAAETYEIIGQIEEPGSTVNQVLTLAGLALIAIGVIGMLIVIICLIKSKKPKRTKAEVYKEEKAPKAPKPQATAKEPVYVSKARPETVSPTLDFTNPDIVIPKEPVVKKPSNNSSKYDTQEILNEFLK